MRTFCAVLCLLCIAARPQIAAAFLPLPELSLSAAGAGQPEARAFGQSLSANAQYLAVGAPGSVAPAVPGSVWVYTRSGDQYSLLNVLRAPTPAPGDGFGQHVQFVGSQLIVGAPFVTVAGTSGHGQVYTYGLIAGQYALAQTLNPGLAIGQNDWFGFHLSADSGWLAIGVPRAGNSDQGQVQLYRYDGDGEVWLYHSALTTTTALGRLGVRVLARGERVLASATEEVFSGQTRGYVYEYLRIGNGSSAVFNQVQRFRPSSFPVVDPGQVFGASLALSEDGTELAVGAPFDQEPPSSQRGAVYVFARNAGQWSQLQRLTSAAGFRAVNFGGALAFEGNLRLLVGDIRESNGSNVQVGGVHEFLRAGPGAWTTARRWSRGAGTSQDFFGNTISVGAGQLVIGSPGHDEGPDVDAGRAHVYNAVFKDGFE